MSNFKKVDVLIVAYAFYSTDARIKSYVYSLENRNLSYEIWALKEDNRNVKNLKFIMMKYQGNNLIKYIFSYIKFFFIIFFKSILNINRFKNIHFHNMPNFIVFAFVFNKIFGKSRIILDLHDDMPVIYMTKYNLSFNNIIIKILRLEEFISCNFVDYCITAVHKMEDELKKRKLNNNKIITILNVPNPKLFKINKKLKEQNKCYKILVHGTITKRLGIDLVLYSLVYIKNYIKNFKLVIVGDGDYLNEFKNLALKLGISNYIEYSNGFVDVEKLQDYLLYADVGIVPYRKNYYSQNYQLPVKLLEYVYFNIPVIAPDFNNIRKYFNENMILFYNPDDPKDLAEKILELYYNKEKRMNLANNAKVFYEKYSWELQEKKYFDILSL